MRMKVVTFLGASSVVHVSSDDIVASLSHNASCLHYILHSTSVEDQRENKQLS